MDVIVVILLHTYLSFIANNGKQLEMLQEAIPVNVYISNIDGTLWEGIDIDDDIVHGLQESEYVKNLYMKTLFKGTFLPEGKQPDHDAMQAKLFLMGINDMKAIGGIEEDDIVWNKGMDGEIFKDSARRCVVSREILDARIEDTEISTPLASAAGTEAAILLVGSLMAAIVVHRNVKEEPLKMFGKEE